jgi:hypothetical protein
MRPFLPRPPRPQRAYVDNNLKDKVLYFCKDCQKIVTVTPVGKKFVYKCDICKTKNVAFGTEKSIRNFYHIKDVEPSKVESSKAVVPVVDEEKKVVEGELKINN